MDYVEDHNSTFDAETDRKHTHRETNEENNKDDNKGECFPCKPSGSTNLALCASCTWANVHHHVPDTDCGVFIPSNLLTTTNPMGSL